MTTGMSWGYLALAVKLHGKAWARGSLLVCHPPECASFSLLVVQQSYP